ncbi:UPF0721 transmembrane protein YrkJ [Paenibacillus sp. CCS19]|uniref:sulfite exporter TauE/SafE family protein n=1 Tax=Paenibacillus sp. CCS19 TaxID=3158387 RepID=UPI002567151C|nr:sulfite exporter TauE/SafE family protein [Paenibacillus cellulosilyticus]GMK42708.1 UPF0721 transmembrane protein YrkJ [Paenibacillus cellulosilyticus]
MDTLLYITMTLLGFVGSFFSGMLGIGGAVINYPLLLYVPSSLGVAHLSAHDVAAISMFQVFFASLAGVLAYRRRSGTDGSVLHKGLVAYMGTSILVGSLIGGIASGGLDADGINLIYGILAVVAVILMLIPNRAAQSGTNETLQFNKIIAVSAAFIVGIVSGIVGAGGAFMLIPIMLTVLRIPTRTTIASSLAIVFISAIGGVIGKLIGGGIPLWPMVFTVIGSLIGAPIGSKVGAKLDVRLLRYGLLILIGFTAIKVWIPILAK